MLRCRRVYFGTALRRDVTVVFAPSCVTMEWRSDTSGLYIETRLAPSHMTSFDLYHGPARGAGGDGGAGGGRSYELERIADDVCEVVGADGVAGCEAPVPPPPVDAAEALAALRGAREELRSALRAR